MVKQTGVSYTSGVHAASALTDGIHAASKVGHRASVANIEMSANWGKSPHGSEYLFLPHYYRA
jgi:hypothetical protein